jgi:Ca-activated chloride channel family protein
MLVFLVVPLALIGLYIVVQMRRQGRLRRFTDAQMPQSPWRHLPIAVSVLGLLLLTVALATPTHVRLDVSGRR